MVKVRVRPFAYLSDALGKRKVLEISLPDGATILDLLSLLRKSYNLKDEIRVDRYTLELFKGDEVRSLKVLLNGKELRCLDGLETRLEEGAEVAIFPLITGG